MKNSEIQNQLQGAFFLSREAVYYWIGDLESANLMEILSSDIKLLEQFINTGSEFKDMKERAEVCYKAVSKSILTDGSRQRSAARSIAHCLFAAWFMSEDNNKKAIKAIEDCKSNAKAALGGHS